MFRFIIAFALLSFSQPCTLIATVDEVDNGVADRPNILYFYVDDMGWGSIGPNAQAKRRAKNKPSVQTPNIDQLAAQGLNFLRGYGCHVCSPARSSQQSGFHQGHTFADRNDPDNAKKAMRADDILMGDALSKAGYVTGYWGKWGYGASKDQNNPVIQNIQTLPTSHGYQHVLTELHHVRAHTFFQPTLWSAPAGRAAVGGLELIPNSMARYQGNKDYPPTPALQDDTGYPRTGYCDDAYAFAALDFVRTQGQNYNKTGQPFFGLLAVQIPHAPFDEISQLPQWNNAYTEDKHFSSLAKQSQYWAAMVTRIDAHLGNILAALEDPNNDGDQSDSIADNTLVIFQSDNGGPSGKSNLEFDANGGLSGTKGKIQEGGIRVPLVMRWPAKITSHSKVKAGTNTNKVVDVTDLLPTFCELAGTTIPLGLDGVSIAPMLTGNGFQRKRDFIIHEAGNGQSIIRGDYKLIRSKKSPLKLYNLKNDHSEKHNIAGKKRDLVKQLETSLLDERVDEPRGFANTYHHWTGKNNALTSDAKNWSDYRYANAGITYMTDNGAPRLSWIAVVENKTNQPKSAQANQDLEFLGLEIRGNLKTGAPQTLVLGPQINLTGRNEIRISSQGKLVVDQGNVSTQRWIEIQSGGTLDGRGSIQGSVFNHGLVSITGEGRPKLEIKSDYHQSSEATLNVSLNNANNTPLVVAGDVVLAGTLDLAVETGFTPTPGKSFTLLTGKQITGKFSNADSKLVTENGIRFQISYSNSAVELKCE